MSDREELTRLAELARSTGDDELELDALRKLDALGSAAPDEGPSLGDFATLAADVGMFGVGSEIASGIEALSPYGADTYSDALKRREEAAARARTSGWSLPVEIGAGLPGAAAISRQALRTIPQRVPAWLQAMGIGSAEGAMYGAGLSPQGERAGGAAQGAVMGGAFGLAGPRAGEAVGAGMQAVGRRATSSPRIDAERALRHAAADEELVPADIVARYEKLGAEGTLADISPNMRTVGRAAADAGGRAKNIASGVLNERQEGSVGRLSKEIEQTIGYYADDFNEAVSAIATRRKTAGNQLYGEAFEEGIEDALVDNPEALRRINELMERPLFKKAWGEAAAYAKNMGERMDPNNILQRLHWTKRALGAGERKAYRSSDPSMANAPEAYTRIRHDLLDVVDELSPKYKQAREMWAGDSELLDAAELGEKFMRQSADEVTQSIRGMSQAEIEMYRRGVVKQIVGVLENTGLTHDATRKLISTQAMRDKLGQVFPTAEAAERFVRRAVIEREMGMTRNAVLGGSQTSTNLRAMENLGYNLRPESLMALADPMGGAAALMIRNVVGRKELTSEIATEIASILFDQGLTPQQIRRIFTGGTVKQALAQAGERLPHFTIPKRTVSTAAAGVTGGLAGRESPE